LNINSIDISKLVIQFFIKRRRHYSRTVNELKMKIVIVLCAIVGLSLGLPEKDAPYPAKGWKPQGAKLELPRQYGAPREQRAEPQPDEIEFTTLTNEYLPPTTAESNDENDVLRVQGLPRVNAVSQFKQIQRPSNVRARPQLSRIQMAPSPAFASQPFLLSPAFGPQFAAVRGQLREQKFGRVEQAPEFNPKNQVQQLPARAYGPPQTSTELPVVEATTFETEIPQSEQPEQPQNEIDYDDESDEEDSDEPTIAISNSDTTGDLVQATQQGQVGQYYILLPDNSLQKVRFATKQTLEDRQINGFSAQLR
jgi:hypothetical protein